MEMVFFGGKVWCVLLELTAIASVLVGASAITVRHPSGLHTGWS